MRLSKFYGFALLLFANTAFTQPTEPLISHADLQFLQTLTKVVLDSSRILPGQKLPDPFGKNNTGGTLVRPGGRNTYPAFWIRDYAMSLETGFITAAEQKHMLLLTAATQCDQTFITKQGGMVPYGAIADHIRIETSVPIYYPGTYDADAQGDKTWGAFPPYCDQFYFIKMAYNYVKTTNDISILTKEINGTQLLTRLEMAFKVPPARQDNQLVFTTADFRGVDFGFRDAITITGDLVYASLLKYSAAVELAYLFTKTQNNTKAAYYQNIALQIKTAVPKVFTNANGMLVASTGTSAQPDVWATALAVYIGVLQKDAAAKAGTALAAAYTKGTLAYHGNIRHITTDSNYNKETAWQVAGVPINTYQNGAYWGTPTGWVAYAIALVNTAAAKQLISEYIADLRETDFRKGAGFNGPQECFYPPNYTSGPVYLTTVSCPYIVLMGLDKRK